MFTPNQIVYAYHGPLIYEAKILKIRRAQDSYILTPENIQETYSQNPKFNIDKWEGQSVYFLHYQGWNHKWDEWVGVDRILEFNDENKVKKLELDQISNKRRKIRSATPSSGSGKDGSGGGSGKEGSSASTGSSGGKSGGGSGQPPTKKQKLKKPIFNLAFPDSLKYLLVNDWEYITKDRKLVSLPSPHPISQILQDYKSYRTNKLSSNQLNVLLEILTGLELYFNKSLKLLLLYKYENLQYLNFLKSGVINEQEEDKCQSKVYGFEHLLRLLISFPGLISQTSMDCISINVLMLEIEELLLFLLERILTYLNNYDFSSPQYDSLSRA